MAALLIDPLLLLCAMLLLSFSGVAAQNFSGYLYVFTGWPTASDFVATVDLMPGSATYGNIVAESPVLGHPIEAHHIGLVNNGAVLAGGSYLDFVLPSRVESCHFWDVATNPRSPAYITSVSGNFSSVPDTFASIPGGGFIATTMGSKNGGTPGRILRFTSDLRISAEYPTTLNPNSFNPHGIAVNSALGVFATADFYEPKSAIVDRRRKRQSPVKFRTTVRLWNLTTFETIEVFDVGSGNATGFMDMKFLGTSRFAVAGNGDGKLYLLDTVEQTFEPVWQPPSKYLPTGTCVSAVFRGGTRILATAFLSRALFLLNFEDPKHPVLLHTYRLPRGANPHAIVITADGSLAAVTCYFLDRAGYSKLVFPGDKTLRFFTVVNDTVSAHPDLRTINFKLRYQRCTSFGGRRRCTGGANPHGMALKAVPRP